MPPSKRGKAAPRRAGRKGNSRAIDGLVAAARSAREHAVADYSHFKVGAALETIDGTIVTGCNVENATYGLTICAERVAMFKALSEGHREFRRIAIVADTLRPTPPCGACRQILWEFARRHRRHPRQPDTTDGPPPPPVASSEAIRRTTLGPLVPRAQGAGPSAHGRSGLGTLNGRAHGAGPLLEVVWSWE